MADETIIANAVVVRRLYAMSMNGASSDCHLCDLVGYFAVALMKFSYFVYDILYNYFFSLAPILMAIWIAWHMSILMTKGGAGGYDAIFSVVRKVLLLGFVALVLAPPGGDKHFVWNTAGTVPLTMGLGFSRDVRNDLNTAISGAIIPNCTGGASTTRVVPAASSAGLPMAKVRPLLDVITDTACAIERAHIFGVTAGMAILIAPPQGDRSFWAALNPVNFVNATLRIVIGVFVMAVWGISVVWYTFAFVDILFKGLIIAAFVPLLALAYLFQVSRKAAVSAFQMSLGAALQGATLALTMALTVFLVSGTVNVYEATWSEMRTAFNGNGDRGSAFMPRITPGASDSLERFLTGLAGGHIPSDISTPWMIYLIMSSLISLMAGKKMVEILSGVTGLASDRDLTFANSFSKGAMGAATIGAMGAFHAGKWGARAGAVGARGGAYAAGAGVSGIERAIPVATSGGSKVMDGIKWANPWGSARLGARNAGLD